MDFDIEASSKLNDSANDSCSLMLIPLWVLLLLLLAHGPLEKGYQ
jgi:hypothetical protein